MSSTPSSIAEIKAVLSRGDASESLLSSLKEDPRKGVRSLALSYEKRRRKEVLEEERLDRLFRYERRAAEKGLFPVAGLDEAGRGPLAGPVAVGAVILPPELKIHHLNDSKKLTRDRRRELFDLIQTKALAYEVILMDHQSIDAIGIHRAVFAAMRDALGRLSVKPEYALVDGFMLPESPVPCEGIIEGDAQSASIAAASIMAKETRDRIMEELDSLYPQYGFAQHKGYGTADHVEALKIHGPSPIHRYSFKIVGDMDPRYLRLKKMIESADNINTLKSVARVIKEQTNELSPPALEGLRRLYSLRKEAVTNGA